MGASIRRLALWAGLGLALVCPSEPARAQPSFDPLDLEGRSISALTVLAPPRESEETLRSLAGLGVGRAYRAAEVRRAVKVLFQLGRFENVFVRVDPEGEGLRVELILTPRPFIREVQISGSEALGESEVSRALALKVGDELDVQSFPERRRQLEERLRRLGYQAPAIGLAATEQDANGGALVVVRVDQGPVTRLRRFVIAGDPRRPFWRLAERLGLAPGDVIDWGRMEPALRRLEEAYRKEGHLEVEIGKPEVRPIAASDPENPQADVHVRIDAGPLVSLRFKGRTVVPEAELDSVFDLLRELGTGRAAIDEARERILLAYERRGYWRARVEGAVRLTPDRARKEVLFSIEEGTPGRVVEVALDGVESLDPELLRAKIFQVVDQSLRTTDFERPGADPETISSLVGDHTRAVPRATRQPSHDTPEVETVYARNAYKNAAGELADMYRAEGFQSAKVADPSVTVGSDGASLHVRFSVEEGLQWRLGVVSFAGNESLDTAKVFAVAGVEPGEPLSFFRLEAARRTLLQAYRDEGHLFASIDQDLREVAPRGSVHLGEFRRGRNVMDVCAEAAARAQKVCEVELVFRIREGPRVRARRILVKGANRTLDALVRGELTIREAETLRASDMRQTQQNLARLGVFSRVSVKPIDEEKEAPEKDVVIDLRERKQWAFELGAGASTEDGVRAFARLAWSNVGGTGLRAQADARISSQPFVIFYASEIRDAITSFYADRPVEYALSLGLASPRLLGLPRGFNAGLDLSLIRETEPAFGEDAAGVRLTLGYTALRPRVLGKERPVLLSLRSFFDASQVKCNQALPNFEFFCGAQTGDLGRRNETQTSYLGGGPTLGWDWRDDRFNPRSGFFVELSPHYLGGLNGESPSHVRLEGRVNAYVPLVLRSTLAFSLVYQHILETSASDVNVPVNRRLFGGGRSTIRGYQERTLFPQDLVLCEGGAPPVPGFSCREAGDKLSPGGLLVFAVKAELRFPLTEGLSLTAFYDVGDVFLDPSNFFLSLAPSERGQTRQGLGAGLRYDTPIGPLILDIGVPLVRRNDPNEVGWTPHFAAVGTF